MGVDFLWQTQVQTTKYGLYDVIGIKKKKIILILKSFTLSDMNFDTIYMSEAIMAKFLSQKI